MKRIVLVVSRVHISYVLLVVPKMQLQLWSDLSQLSNSLDTLATLLISRQHYDQLLQGDVSTSSLEYGFLHIAAVSNANIQHLE